MLASTKSLYIRPISLILFVQKSFYSNSFAHVIFRTFEFPASCVESLLMTTHSTFHLPWWVVIATTTLSLRALVSLPLHVLSQRSQAKADIAFTELDTFRKPLEYKIISMSRRDGLDVNQANFELKKAFRDLRKDILSKHKINLKLYRLQVYLSPLIQLPLFISISMAIRNLSGALPDWYKTHDVIPSMKIEGFVWFSDLTLPDPYYVIPAIFLMANIINISIYSRQIQKQSLTLKFVNNLFRCMTFAMAGVATQMPAGIAMYWMLSGCYGLFQNLFFKYSKVRRLFKIPKSKSESNQPIRDILNSYRTEWTGFLEKQREYHRKLK